MLVCVSPGARAPCGLLGEPECQTYPVEGTVRSTHFLCTGVLGQNLTFISINIDSFAFK